MWANRQVLDTDNWATASSEVLEIPAVRTRTAQFLADKAYEVSDIETRISDALPPRLQPLAAPAAGLLRDRLEKRAEEALARPDVQQLWEDANRATHQRLLEALRSSGPVTIDLHRLLVAVQNRAGFGGRAAAVIPEGAATVTVLRSDQLDTARKGLKILDALPIVLVVLSLALAAAAIGWSPGRRRRVVRGYGIGLIAAGALALGAEAFIGDTLVDSLARTADGIPVVEGVFGIYTTLLDEAAIATILYGVVAVLGTWLAGETRWAVAVRRFVAPYLRQPEVAWGAFAVLVGIVFLWWAPTPATRKPATADRADRAARARHGGAPPPDRAGVPADDPASRAAARTGRPGAVTERLRWLGHATVALEIGGATLLTDPVLRNRIAHLRRHAPPAVAPPCARRGPDLAHAPRPSRPAVAARAGPGRAPDRAARRRARDAQARARGGGAGGR